MMRPLLIGLSIVSVGVGVSACGGASRGAGSVSRRTTVVEHVLTVSRELGPIDGDDYAILDFGHPADAAEKGKIAALVRRYYEVAVAEDGAKACSMLYPVTV